MPLDLTDSFDLKAIGTIFLRILAVFRRPLMSGSHTHSSQHGLSSSGLFLRCIAVSVTISFLDVLKVSHFFSSHFPSVPSARLPAQGTALSSFFSIFFSILNFALLSLIERYLVTHLPILIIAFILLHFQPLFPPYAPLCRIPPPDHAPCRIHTLSEPHLDPDCPLPWLG